MDKKEEEFLKRLQAMFKTEADDHIKSLASDLIELEKSPDSETYALLVENVFRETHSLKGAARSVERDDIESICQEMESFLYKIKNNKTTFTPVHFDIMHTAIDQIIKLIHSSESCSNSEKRSLLKNLKSISSGEQPSITNIEQNKEPISKQADKPDVELPASDAGITSAPLEKLSESDTVRIHTSKLSTVLLQAEQFIQSKIASHQGVEDINKLIQYVNSWKIDFDEMDSSDICDESHSTKAYIEYTRSKFHELEETLESISQRALTNQRSLARMIDEHLDSIKQLLMLPISSIVEGFPKLVRDLARSQGKEVELIIKGKSIEVDKRILEDLKDPLIHLVRNCIDHGIGTKTSTVNTDDSKSSRGIIKMEFSSADGRKLGITISDNGAGIDVKSVLAAAIKEGVISADKAKTIDSNEVKNLIFNSGISTSPIITDISGRGLGLAIVKEKVDKLGGTITVESESGFGTAFHITLPLTISTFRGVLVKSNKQLFYIPTVNIKFVIREQISQIKTVENRETISYEDMIIPIVRLSDILGINKSGSANNNLTESNKETEYIQILVLEYDNQQIGFIVDQIIEEHQILVKKLGKQLKRVQNIAGVAVLGSGKVVPVINVTDIMNSTVQSGRASKTMGNKPKKNKTHQVLVTEDSITSRTLLKEILETAGYLVETAVNGLDGLLKAQAGNFDLIVSDVDMPKMNGFELTARIRNDERLSDLPIILVTALGSKEDMEHGLDVGANAYIVKSSFEQSNLLEVAKKLL